MARSLNRWTAVVVALCAWPAFLDAQACLGRPGQGAGPFRVGSQYESAEGGNGLAFFAGGLGSRFFAEVVAGSVSYDNLDGSSLILGAQTGYRVPLGSNSLFEICPFIGGALGFGPDDIYGTNIDVSTRSLTGGLAMGRAFRVERTVPVIPSIGVQFSTSGITYTDGTSNIRESDQYGIFTAGIAFIVERQVSVQPWVSVPFGIDVGPSYGTTLVLVLGRPRTIESR